MMQVALSRRALVAMMLMAWCAGASASPAEAVTPREAIERAAFDRLGAGVVRVEVGAVSTSVEAHAALVAVPDPAGSVGRSVRFTLLANGRRRGVAIASVRVRARVATAVQAIERDQMIPVGALRVVETEIEGVPYRRLPQLDDIVGTRARRDIDPGVVVTSGMFVAPLDVQSGERVAVRVTIGTVHVTGEGIASGSGRVGDLVHVSQPGRRGLLRGRIADRGVVEIQP
jgi:flagella basal body P-ring formation protein FlgA